MIKNKKSYIIILLMTVLVLALLGTKNLAASSSRPGRVTGLTGSINTATDICDISWDDVDGATSYKIYINDSFYKSGRGTRILIRNASDYGNEIEVYIVATNKYGDGPASNSITIEPSGITGGGIGGGGSSSGGGSSGGSTTTSTPGQVTGVKASISSNVITVSWNKVSGATGYKVYSKGPSETSFTASSTALTSTRIYGCSEKGTYQIFVSAYNSNGLGIGSNITNVTNSGGSSSGGGSSGGSTTTSLGKVTGVSGKVDTSKDTLNIQWKAVSGATGYKVYLSPTGYGTPTYNKTVTGTSVSYTGAKAGGNSFQVYIVATNGKVDGPASDTVTINESGSTGGSSSGGGSSGGSTTDVNVPKVTGLEACIVSSPEGNYLRLLWDELENGIEIKIETEPHIDIGFGQVYSYEGSWIVDLDLNKFTATTYTIKVSAVINGKEGEPATIKVKIPSKTELAKYKPAKITNIVLKADPTVDEPNRIRLDFRGSNTVTGYTIEFDDQLVDMYDKSGITTRYYELPAENRTYKVNVQAYKEIKINGIECTIYSDNSIASYTHTGIGSAAKPTKVEGLKGRMVEDELTLTWNPVSGAAKYRVYYNVYGTPVEFEVVRPSITKKGFVESYKTNEVYVVAINANGEEGPASNKLKFSMYTAQIKDLKVTSTNGNDVTIGWSRIGDASGYKIYYNISGIGDATGETTSTSVKNNVPSTGYSSAYVRAIKESGAITYESKASNTVKFKGTGSSGGTTPTTNNNQKPGKVAGIAWSIKDNKLIIQWNKADNATKYEAALYSPSNKYIVGKVITIGKTASKGELTCSTSSLKESGEYKVVITPYNETVRGNSVQSTYKYTTTTSPTTPTTPSTGSLGQGGEIKYTVDANLNVKLTWDTVDNASAYQIRYKEKGQSRQALSDTTFKTKTFNMKGYAGKTIIFEVYALRMDAQKNVVEGPSMAYRVEVEIPQMLKKDNQIIV